MMLSYCSSPSFTCKRSLVFLLLLWRISILPSACASWWGKNEPRRQYSLPAPLGSVTLRAGSSEEQLVNTTSHDNNNTHSSKEDEVLGEEVVYRGWRTITRRKVRLRNGVVVDFDIVGQGGHDAAVMVFAWNTYTQTATLVREYMPGGHRRCLGLAAGLIDDRHATAQMAAQLELEEECHLTGGTWIRLADSTLMDKYASTRVIPYLVLDPVKTTDPSPRDPEEDMEIVEHVTVEELRNCMLKGEMNLVSGWACSLALQKLRDLGQIPSGRNSTSTASTRAESTKAVARAIAPNTVPPSGSSALATSEESDKNERGLQWTALALTVLCVLL